MFIEKYIPANRPLSITPKEYNEIPELAWPPMMVDLPILPFPFRTQGLFTPSQNSLDYAIHLFRNEVLPNFISDVEDSISRYVNFENSINPEMPDTQRLSSPIRQCLDGLVSIYDNSNTIFLGNYFYGSLFRDHEYLNNFDSFINIANFYSRFNDSLVTVPNIQEKRVIYGIPNQVTKPDIRKVEPDEITGSPVNDPHILIFNVYSSSAIRDSLAPLVGFDFRQPFFLSQAGTIRDISFLANMKIPARYERKDIYQIVLFTLSNVLDNEKRNYTGSFFNQFQRNEAKQFGVFSLDTSRSKEVSLRLAPSLIPSFNSALLNEFINDSSKIEASVKDTLQPLPLSNNYIHLTRNIWDKFNDLSKVESNTFFIYPANYDEYAFTRIAPARRELTKPFAYSYGYFSPVWKVRTDNQHGSIVSTGNPLLAKTHLQTQDVLTSGLRYDFVNDLDEDKTFFSRSLKDLETPYSVATLDAIKARDPNSSLIVNPTSTNPLRELRFEVVAERPTENKYSERLLLLKYEVELDYEEVKPSIRVLNDTATRDETIKDIMLLRFYIIVQVRRNGSLFQDNLWIELDSGGRESSVIIQNDSGSRSEYDYVETIVPGTLSPAIKTNEEIIEDFNNYNFIPANINLSTFKTNRFGERRTFDNSGTLTSTNNGDRDSFLNEDFPYPLGLFSELENGGKSIFWDYRLTPFLISSLYKNSLPNNFSGDADFFTDEDLNESYQEIFDSDILTIRLLEEKDTGNFYNGFFNFGVLPKFGDPLISIPILLTEPINHDPFS